MTNNNAQRGYRHAIDKFVQWYCSEPRLALNRVVVLRYRSHPESQRLAPGTINLRLGAVRRLAFEAADCGSLSSDLAAGIRRVRGLNKTVSVWETGLAESRPAVRRRWNLPGFKKKPHWVNL